MIKIFIGNLLSNIPPTEILYPNLGNKEYINPFGEKVFSSFTVPIVEIVETPELADYLCVPHNYNYLKKNQEYISNFVGLSEKHSKKILVFFPGDSDEEISIPNSIIFRNSKYKYEKKKNEIIMPAYAVDLGQKYGLEYRGKGPIPVVGFCGWASYGSLTGWLSYFIKCILNTPVVKKPGLYFRRKALTALSTSEKVKTNFVIRSSYSGSEKTLTIDPKIARKEYVENMKNSELILAPKGDGNFSVRFFEALSLGRIPLLIDTDCSLPLENEINYRELIFKVDHSKIKELASKVSEFYAEISEEEYLVRQKKCREVFEKYLKIESFFAYVLDEAFLKKIAYTIGTK